VGAIPSHDDLVFHQPFGSAMTIGAETFHEAYSNGCADSVAIRDGAVERAATPSSSRRQSPPMRRTACAHILP
jgi:hypothetical protein